MKYLSYKKQAHKFWHTFFIKNKHKKDTTNKKGLYIKVLVKVSGLYQSEALKPNICKIYLTVR